MICREIEIVYNRAKRNCELKQITMPSEVYAHCHEFFPMGEINLRERFYAIYLNNAGRVLGVLEASIGNGNTVSVDVRLILATGLKCMARGIILVHNHPSGNLKPSLEDDKITQRIADGAKLLDMRVRDHLIITDGGYYAYSDHGRIY